MTAAAHAVPALPNPYSPALAADRLVTVAVSQIGYREGRAGTTWTNDNAYGVWYGFNDVSWCAQYVSWCAYRAGYLDKIIPKHQWTPSGYAWFKAHGRAVSSPRRGDIMYVWNAGPNRISHVGIVEKTLSSTTIQTVEGNTNTSGSAQGNGVYRLERKLSSRLYFARPDYSKVVIPRPKPQPAKPSKPVDIQVTSFSLAVLRLAATKNTLTAPQAAQRAAAMRSLKVLGMTASANPPKGVNWYDHFRAAWRKYQLSLGFKGKDADGIPGATSVQRFARRTGKKYTA